MKITLEYLDAIVTSKERLAVAEEELDEVRRCYEFLKVFARDKVVYGINTGFGPMAQWRVDDRRLKDLQYNIIRSHATGAGAPLDDACVKAAMVARVGSVLQARSGVHPDVVRLMVGMVNCDVVPFVPEHGSVGASGDLVQLAHIALGMIGEGEVHHKGVWREAKEVLKECGLEPMKVWIREGLCVTNGISVMTGISAVNQLRAERLLDWAVLTGVWMNEVAGSYDDFMAEELNVCRRHKGQTAVAECMRRIGSTSKRLKRRECALYDSGHKEVKVFEEKVQAYYSLRCTPQILGPIWETLQNARRVIEEELNAASDNPIVDPTTRSVFHGGNFHGDCISMEEDKVKMAVVKLAVTAERQLNYLFHDRINGILPPFLNMGELGLNYGMQACQFTATSTTAECQTLAMPNYVHSIPNNNDNQDVVSMGTNSALLCKRVVENGFQVMAILVMALAQATDCLGIRDELSDVTRGVYDDVRRLSRMIVEDRPLYEDVERVISFLSKTKTLRQAQGKL